MDTKPKHTPGAQTILWLISNTVYECQIARGYCPFCGSLDSVVELPPPVLAEQPDATTHVCHPGLNGCNQGFAHRPG